MSTLDIDCGKTSNARPMRRSRSIAPAVGLCLLGLAAGGCAGTAHGAENTPGVRLARIIPLPGVTATRTNVGVPGRIDHLAYDPATKRLFVAALENGSLEVIDAENGVRLRSLKGLSRPQGAAVVAGSSSVAVACGGDGLLVVFDTRTLQETHRLWVGPDADNVRYDAASRSLYVSCGDTNSGAISVVDTVGWQKLRELAFPSRPESFQLEPDGSRLFANLPQGIRAVKDGKVAVTDRQTGAARGQVSLVGRARNFPLAFDPAHDRLFLACRRPARVMVIDATQLQVVHELPCVDDSDDLFYDAETSRVFVIGGGFRADLQEPGTASPASPPGRMGALEAFEVEPGGRLRRVGALETVPHARTGLFVPARRALYLAVPMQPGRDPEIREYAVDQPATHP